MLLKMVRKSDLLSSEKSVRPAESKYVFHQKYNIR